MKESTSESYLSNLNKIFEYFDFNKSFDIKLVQTNPESLTNDLKSSIYSIDSPIQDQLRIDFGQIIEDYKLNFYDKNLKQTQGNLLND